MGQIKDFKKIILGQIIDHHDGKISVAESFRNIPFRIKRVYYIYDFDSEKSVRGYHAHKNLEQVLFCISGTVTLKLDDGFNTYEEEINEPHKGIFIGKHVWHTMRNFSDDCVVLVLASDYFNESDYIRDYDEFLNTINKDKI